MVYADTVVTQGVGVVLVTATGGHTYTSHLRATARRTRPPPTPLQSALKRLAFRLTLLAVSLSLLLLGLALLLPSSPAISWELAVLSALSLLFATIPEELPILVKLLLAVGGVRMGGRGVLVKTLKAVEGLGGVGVVLTDKTGTLTEGRLTVKEGWLGLGEEEGEGVGEAGRGRGRGRRRGGKGCRDRWWRAGWRRHPLWGRSCGGVWVVRWTPVG